MIKNILEKASAILVKYQVIEKEIKDIGEALKDHEKRITKLEATYDTEITKLENKVLKFFASQSTTVSPKQLK